MIDYSIESKKSEGIFYTPELLSDYLSTKVFKYLGTKVNLNVLDPACGDNSLVESFAKLNKDHSSLYHGFDKDFYAVERMNLKYEGINNQSFKNLDFLTPLGMDLNPFNAWDSIKTEMNLKDGFDVILSNPPWGADLNNYINLSSYFQTAVGQYDIFSLFTELIISNLAEGGIYGLILPDSIFSAEQIGFRRLLLENSRIKFIGRLGEKFFPNVNRACVVLIGEKGKPHHLSKVDCFRLDPVSRKRVLKGDVLLSDIDSLNIHKVPQSRFLKNRNFALDIDMQNSEVDLVSKVSEARFTFKDYLLNKRGVELSKKGKIIQCSSCNLWIPMPKKESFNCSHCKCHNQITTERSEVIVLNHNGKGNVPFLAGEDLDRYFTNQLKWLNVEKKGINYKDKSLYKGDKILVRKTGVGITSSIDYKECITNQVVYVLKLKEGLDRIFTLELFIAILNSRLMTYYLIKKYGETEWKSHPYITQTMVNDLPFPFIEINDLILRKRIQNLSKRLKTAIISKKQKLSTKIEIDIEKLVADLFDFTAKDYISVYKTLEECEPLVPIKRLLNIKREEIWNGL